MKIHDNALFCVESEVSESSNIANEIKSLIQANDKSAKFMNW